MMALKISTPTEADTIVPHQVLASVAGDSVRELSVWSLDTDVYYCCFILSLGPNLGLTQVGKDLKQREIDVVERCALLDVTNVGDWSNYTTLRALSGVECLSGSQKGVGGCLHEIRRTQCCHFLLP